MAPPLTLSSWQSSFLITQICHSDRDYPSKLKEKRMTCKRLHAILFQVLQSEISVCASVVILTLIISLTIHLILLSQLAWTPLDANLEVTILIKIFMMSLNLLFYFWKVKIIIIIKSFLGFLIQLNSYFLVNISNWYIKILILHCLYHY